MNRNPSPKSELLKNTEALKNHHTLIENDILRLHFSLTIAELQRRASQVDPTNFNLCASAHLRMLGAHEFVDAFYNLAESPEIGKRTDNTNLASNLRK